MEIKAKVFRRKSGKSEGKWIIRIEYFDEVAGRTRYMNRHAARRSDAIDERDRLIKDLEKTNGQIQGGERMTFQQLVAIAKETFYKPAVIVEGRKLKNTIRSHRTVHGQLDILCRFFGKRHIQQITKQSLEDYKLWRLKNGSLHSANKDPENKRPVKLATINRELSAMRRVMLFAYEEKGWLAKELSFKGVIDMDAERPRHRILTPIEEVRLLNACHGERQRPYERKRFGRTENISAKQVLENPRLKAAILLALDGGLRRTEILKLDWTEIDFENNRIRVLGTHTKTEQERVAPLSARAKEVLLRIREMAPSEAPFPFSDFKRSWATAKSVAKIDDLRFHDLRRTAITRWIQQGNPIEFAGKMAGHTQLQTTQKHYIATDADMVSAIAANMNRFHTASAPEIQTPTDSVN